MARYCSDCTNIDLKKKKGPGCYMCKKSKKYVLTNTYECEKFENAYARKSYEKEKLYDEAKDFKEEDKDVPILLYIFIFIILLIVKLLTD